MPKKILIVEDTDDTRLMLKFFIEDCGYEAIEAKNGFEALDILKEKIPDLILMDLSMPDMDGLTAVKSIKGNSVSSKIPIVAVTALDSSLADEAIQAGCDDIIGKPVDFSLLESVIKQFLPTS